MKKREAQANQQWKENVAVEISDNKKDSKEILLKIVYE